MIFPPGPGSSAPPPARPAPPTSAPPRTPETKYRQKSNMVALQKMSSSDTENTRRKDPLDTPPAADIKESASSGSKDSGVDLASPVLRAAHAQEAGASFSDLAASEEADSEAPRPRPAHHRYPHADEKISLLTFEEIKTRYFQIQLEDEGLLVDKIIPGMADCCSRCVAEVLGKFIEIQNAYLLYISHFLYFILSKSRNL